MTLELVINKKTAQASGRRSGSSRPCGSGDRVRTLRRILATFAVFLALPLIGATESIGAKPWRIGILSSRMPLAASEKDLW